ncbi:MAG: PIN domain-containing protein, partial [Rhodoferax sp.]
MPLPTAPAKRAALLSEKDYGVPARSQVKPETPDIQSTAVVAAPKPRRKPVMNVAAAPGEAQPTTATSTLPAIATKAAKQPATRASEPNHVTSIPDEDVKKVKAKSTGPKKLFVLDTNVLLHDPMCLFRFEEHDIFLPMIVLEELDGHKKGMTEVARNARQTSRTLDALAGQHGSDIATGLALNTTGHRQAGGKLFFQTQLLNYTLPSSLP